MFRILFIIGIVAFFVVAQDEGLAESDSAGTIQHADSTHSVQTELDSETGSAAPSSVAPGLQTVQTAKPGTASPIAEKKEPVKEPEQQSVKKIKLIKRDYNYHREFALAIGMMAFIAVIMASSQNWNPN